MLQSCRAYNLNSKVPFVSKTISNSLIDLYLVVYPLYYSCRCGTVILCQNTGYVSHNCDGYFHQLWHFALSRLFYPIEHALFGYLLIVLYSYLSELLFEIVCL